MRLDRALGRSDQPAAFEVGAHAFELSRFGRRGERFRLANSDLSLIVGPDRDGFEVVVTLHALYLRTTALPGAIREALALVAELTTVVPDEIRVRRLDLCADATGITFDRNDEDCFVSRARRVARFHPPDRVFTRKRSGGPVCTGFMFAPGNSLMVRIYDKTEELFAVHGQDSQKTRTELQAFRAAGWNGHSSVWRLEAQLRTGKLRALGIHSPDELLTHLDSLWHYVVGHPDDANDKTWLRHVRRHYTTRPERCPTSDKWRLFQNARFVGSKPLERADGHLGGARLPVSLGMMHSTLGASANLPLASNEAPDDEVTLIRADVARFADHIIAHPKLRKDYRRRRDAAAGRFAAGGAGRAEKTRP